MTDVELSLAVARIMYPKYKWVEWGGVAVSDNDGMEFSYKDKDCAWDMAVWLHRGTSSCNGSRKTRLSLLAFSLAMFKDCPQHALAMAIKETGEDV